VPGVAKQEIDIKNIVQYGPAGGFTSDIQAFAAIALEPQLKRNAADYDPLPRYRRSDALFAIGTARAALSKLKAASSLQREAFLGLLTFKPR
jgi:hypothetical protein